MMLEVCSVLLPLLPKNAFFTSNYVFSSWVTEEQKIW